MPLGRLAIVQPPLVHFPFNSVLRLPSDVAPGPRCPGRAEADEYGSSPDQVLHSYTACL